MSFKRMPDGRIEVTDTKYGACIITEAKNIVGLVTDRSQYSENDGPVTKVAFSTKSDLAAVFSHRDEPNEPIDKDRPLFMFIREDVSSARISLRKAMGMTEEEVSEELGMEMLAEVP